MKTFTKISAIAIIMIGFSSSAFAQGASTTATSTAVIIAPITITKNVDMVFGNVAVSGSLGTVILATDGTRTRTGGVSIPAGAQAGSPAAASFAIGGEGTFTYAITLPSSDQTITRVSGSETMIVNTFVSNPSGTGTLSSGAQTLLVGATLHVAGGQVAGTYTNGAGFTVSVNYN